MTLKDLKEEINFVQSIQAVMVLVFIVAFVIIQLQFKGAEKRVVGIEKKQEEILITESNNWDGCIELYNNAELKLSNTDCKLNKHIKSIHYGRPLRGEK